MNLACRNGRQTRTRQTAEAVKAVVESRVQQSRAEAEMRSRHLRRVLEPRAESAGHLANPEAESAPLGPSEKHGIPLAYETKNISLKQR